MDYGETDRRLFLAPTWRRELHNAHVHLRKHKRTYAELLAAGLAVGVIAGLLSVINTCHASIARANAATELASKDALRYALGAPVEQHFHIKIASNLTDPNVLAHILADARRDASMMETRRQHVD